MKNLFYLSMSILISCTLLITSSCDKQEMEPELVPITTSGKNTMGFYVNGEIVNIEGVLGGFCSCGVSGGVSQDNIIRVLGGSDEPNYTVRFYFPQDSINSNKEIFINEFIYKYEEMTFRDDSQLGGRKFGCDSSNLGKVKILRLDDQVLAGTFEFDAIHAESGETIQFTDGRFDIKWN